MGDRMSGGCACGKVRFTVAIDDDDAYACHCRMCQRSSGSVSLAMKGVEQAAVEWQGEPRWYGSSPIAERPFCGECGTSLGFRYLEGTSKMDLTVAAFDDPSRFTPSSNFGAESANLHWLDLSGLRDIRSDDYAPLAKRWSEAGASPPE